jgi:hypothetical protein
MAFDRTRPPGEAVLAETPQDAYSLEFGRTYVPYEEIERPLLLGERQTDTLAAWAERLIPAEGSWPSAATVEAHVYADNCAARSPLLRSMLLGAVEVAERTAWQAYERPFAQCTDGQRDELLDALESGPDAVLFDLVLELIFEGYYRAESVLAVVQQRTGFIVRAPLDGVALEPFDESLLERVKRLPRVFREAPP